MEAVAKLKNVPMSPRKMRMVVDTVRGKNVDQALDILEFTKREGAIWLKKVVLSAIANWEHKNNMTLSADDYDLRIKTAMVGEGTMLKRFRPAPHGRAHRIRKRRNHVTIVVENFIPIKESDQPQAEEETENED